MALSATLKTAARAPATEGVKTKTMVHVPPAATDAPQALFSVKSPEFVPDMAIPVTLKAELPELVRVTVSAALAEPTDSPPKATLEGERVTPVETPVPDRGTACGATGSVVREG